MCSALRALCKSKCRRRREGAGSEELCELGEVGGTFASQQQAAGPRVHTPVTPIRDGSAGPEILPRLAFEN